VQANGMIQYTTWLITNNTASTLEHTQTRLKLQHTTLALEGKHQLHDSVILPLQRRRYRNHGNTTGATHAEDDDISTDTIVLHNNWQHTLTNDTS